jgi:hypothetical protein
MISRVGIIKGNRSDGKEASQSIEGNKEGG